MSNTTTAFISLLGRPNVGKSSLLNKILGQKVAIVSSKPQTTRTRIMGVYNSDNKQTVFIDTPGFHKPHNLLGEKMIKAVSDGLSNVDAVLLIVDAFPKFKFDADKLPPAELQLIENIKASKLKAILVINKIDLLQNKEDLFGIISAYSSVFDFEAVVPLSAKTGDGVDILLNELNKFQKPSPHYFSDDDYTDQPDELLVSELIREKLLRSLKSEVPHGIAVCIDKFSERDLQTGEPIVDVEATVYCEKETHKGIIIGKGGAMLKQISIDSRKDIENFFGIRVNLKLWVKVKEDWRNIQSAIHTFGLD